MSFFEGYEKEAPRLKVTPEEPKEKSINVKIDDWLEENPIGQKVGSLIDKIVEMPDEKVERGTKIAGVLIVALLERRRAKKAFARYQAGEDMRFQDYEALATYAIGRAAFVVRELTRRHGVMYPKKES